MAACKPPFSLLPLPLSFPHPSPPPPLASPPSPPPLSLLPFSSSPRDTFHFLARTLTATYSLYGIKEVCVFIKENEGVLLEAPATAALEVRPKKIK